VKDDRESIRTVLSEYCFRMDEGDFKAVAGLFVEDGEWVTPYVQAKGRSDIETTLRRINPPPGPERVRKHVTLNDIVDIEGEEAHSRASYLVLVRGPSGPELRVAGMYQDDLVRVEGRWLIRRRQLVHEIVGDLGLQL
jgi:ketosteroid isomerase-like protein